MPVSSPCCEFEVDRGPNCLLVKIKGLEDSADAPPLARKLWSLLEQHFTYRLVLEMDEVDLLDSHLIGQLLALGKRIEDRDGILRLCGLSEQSRRVLETCHLSRRFLSYHDRKDAIMGPRRPHHPR